MEFCPPITFKGGHGWGPEERRFAKPGAGGRYRLSARSSRDSRRSFLRLSRDDGHREEWRPPPARGLGRFTPGSVLGVVGSTNGDLDSPVVYRRWQAATLRTAARAPSASKNLKQMGLAMHNYHESMGASPTARGNLGIPKATPLRRGGSSWLPLIDEKALYDQFKAPERPWGHESNKTLLARLAQGLRLSVVHKGRVDSSPYKVGLVGPRHGSRSRKGRRASAASQTAPRTTLMGRRVEGDGPLGHGTLGTSRLPAKGAGAGLGSLPSGGFNACRRTARLKFLKTFCLAPPPLDAMITREWDEVINRRPY